MKSKSSLIISLVILALLAGGLPALASSTTAVPQLPWDFDTVVNDANTGRISVGFDAYTRAPMVVYYDWDAQRLTQAVYRGPGFAGNCGPSNTWYCVIVGTDLQVGVYNAVGYFSNPYADNYRKTGFFLYDPSHNSLEFVTRYANDSSTGQTQTTVINLTDYCLGQECVISSAISMVYDAGGHAHAVAVIDSAGDDNLVYFYDRGTPGGNCDNYGGSDYWDFNVVIAENNEAKDPSITIVPPNSPRIAYYRPPDSSLHYAYPSDINANCDTNGLWRCITIDNSAATGYYPSIAYGDALHIAYFNDTDMHLYLAKYVGSGGNCGFDLTGNKWQCEAIDFIGGTSAQRGISLVMDGSEPVIAYMDANDGDQTEVKLAQRVQRVGLTYGNCGPGDIFQTWDCQTLDQGPYSLGAEVEMFITPRGGLFLGYLEDNYDAYEVHVLAARQYYKLSLPLIRK